MNEFAKALRAARLLSGRTFREIARAIEKSIGYVSDLDSGRKNPPDEETVAKIEQLLDIHDGHLRKLAQDVRMSVPKHLKSLVTQQPKLSEFLQLGEALLREDELFVDRILEDMRNRVNAGSKVDEADSLFYDYFITEHFKYSGQGGGFEWADQ